MSILRCTWCQEEATILRGENNYCQKHFDARLKEIKFIKDKNFLNAAPKLKSDKKVAVGFGNIDPGNFDRIIENKDAKYDETTELKTEFLDLIKDKNVSSATEVLVKHILEKNKIYTTKNDQKTEMWVYKDGVYEPEGKSHIKEIIRRVLDKWYSQFYVNIIISKVEADTFIETDKFFKNNNKQEIACQNGLLNIFTKELNPFTPDKVFFNKIPVHYSPEAVCPKIEKFLSDVFSREDDALVFYELGGFALLKEYKYEKAFMFHGNGRNGKGKTIDLLRRTIGTENCVSIPLTSLVSDSFQISELFGKSLNLAGDLSNNDLKDTGMFKSLTGRDLINGKRKFLKDISFENYAKFVFACNDLPMVYDLSKGFWERWILLDFPYYFADKELYDQTDEKEREKWKIKDDGILDKITGEDELSGLLNKFLGGLDRLMENNKFSIAKGSEEIKNTWIRKANSFIAFCMDNIEEDYEGHITKKDIRKKYNQYCKKHRVGGKGDKMIKSVLQEMFGATEERVNQDLSGPQYNYDWSWMGIKYKLQGGKSDL